ncbi:MAG: LamG domain-containing protein [Planctomycetota bacterium]
MRNRMIVLISFVLILSLCGNVSAKDLNPPDFAGGNQTGVVFWEFNEDNDQPTGFRYRPRSRDEDERFGFRYYDDSWKWQNEGYLAMDGGEESLVMPLPAGDGANLRGYMQVMWEGQLEDPPLGVAPEIWLDYDAEFLNEEEITLEPLKNIEIGNHRWYTTFEWTFEDWPGLAEATHCHLIWNLDTDYEFRLDEVIIDLVIFDGDEPPAGPGRTGVAAEVARDKTTHPATPDKDAPPTLDTGPHLMGWWKFDETTGKTASDSSRHKRNGTLDGPTFDKASADGKVGKALKLDRDGAVEIKGYKGVTGTAPRTVTAWIKTTETRGDIAVWGERDSGKHFRFTHIRRRIGMTPHGGYYYMKEYVNDDKWHHIAVVVKESELPNLHDDIVLYLDGEVAIIDDIGLLDLMPVETAKKDDVRIGGGYEGLIDEVRIYSRALSIDEIKAIQQGRSNRPLAK